jgi:undecaprenyl-diphosphatase
MDLLQAIILGLIQGITEWLPISSTGHLRIAQYFFGLTLPLLFDVILHGGTLVVVLIYFRKDIVCVLIALFRRDFKSEHGKLLVPIVVGSIPTALVGVFIGTELNAYFSNLLPLSIGFLATGIMIFSSRFSDEKKDTVGYPEALLIGAIQGLSIIPSISRSGFTIALALLLGIKRKVAFKFSFLLSIPAVAGALGFTIYDSHEALTLAGIGYSQVIAALIITMITGFLALKLLWKTIAARKFYLFSFYCWLIGIALLILFLSGF